MSEPSTPASVPEPAATAAPAASDPATPAPAATTVPEPTSPTPALIGTPAPSAEPAQETSKEPAQEPSEPPKNGAPESYSDFTLPEGTTMSEESLSEFKDLAKKYNLPQESAQELISFGEKHFTQIQKGVVENLNTEFGRMRETWRSELASDKEFGGSKMDETVTRASRVLGIYFPASVSELLAQGFGDHAGLIIGLAKIDKALGETSVPSSSGAPQSKTSRKSFYPNSNMND